jgi:hypothetical protein
MLPAYLLLDMPNNDRYYLAPQIPAHPGAAMSSEAYGIVHFFPGGTQEQYEASIAAVHPAPGQLPEGQIFHAAGPSEGGWTIMAVHESKASWEKFRDGTLLPKLQAGVPGGFTSPPNETAVDLYSVVP